MSQIETVLRELPTPEVAIESDVRRGERALRRRRLTAASTVLATAAVVGGTGWFVGGADDRGVRDGGDDPQVADRSRADAAPAAGPITWKSLQPPYDSPIFPGDDELQVPLDANTVPALEVLVPLLDPEGDHVRPPAGNASPELIDGRPTQVTVYLGWQDGADVVNIQIRLAASRSAAQWECAKECVHRDVAGGTLLSGVTDAGSHVTGMEQADGEWVTVYGEVGEPLTEEQILAVLTSDIDLPARDLNPQPPEPAFSFADMRAIGEDVLNVGPRRIATEVDRQGGSVGGRLTVGGKDVDWIGWKGMPVAEARAAVDEEGGSCNPDLWVECLERDIDGATITVKYDDRYPDTENDGRILVEYLGPTTYVSVWLGFEGEIGSETPSVPYEDIYQILLDPRWQE